MSLLYKYLDLGKIGVLKSMALATSDPALFNDPFEVRPCFDQERHDHFAKSHESFYARLGFSHSLVADGSFVGLPTENAVGFGEHLNQSFRQGLSKKFRVLCLSRNPASVLMWGHYARSHKGFAIGIDTSIAEFPCGLRNEGFEVNYAADRSAVKLPLAYYQTPSVETFDFRGNIVNRPDELVVSDGGIAIPFSEYQRQMADVELKALTTKAIDWGYEKEVRFIYQLPEHSKQLCFEDGRYLASIPKAALREIIFGFHAPVNLVSDVVQIFNSGTLGTPKLFFAECHPFLFEVQRHEAQPQYLLDYYKIVKPAQ